MNKVKGLLLLALMFAVISLCSYSIAFLGIIFGAMGLGE